MATHHLFISDQALHIIVVDLSIGRIEAICNNMLEWMKALQAHVQGGRVIVVGTHTDCLVNSESETEADNGAKASEIMKRLEQSMGQWLNSHFKDMRNHLEQQEKDLGICNMEWTELKEDRETVLDKIDKYLLQNEGLSDRMAKVAIMQLTSSCDELHKKMSEIEHALHVQPQVLHDLQRLRHLLSHQPVILGFIALSSKTYNNVDVLRHAIDEVGKMRPVFPLIGMKVPLSYLMIEHFCSQSQHSHITEGISQPDWQAAVLKHIKKYKASSKLQELLSKPYVRVSELTSASSECDIDSEELDRALEFLHEVGSILFYSKNATSTNLKGVVFTQPQWIIDAIKQIVHDSRDECVDQEMRDMHSKIVQDGKGDSLAALMEQGKLCSDLLRKYLWGSLWKKELAQLFPCDSHDILISLLKDFRLLKEANIQKGSKTKKYCQVCSTDQHPSYVIPSMFSKQLLSSEWIGPDSVWCPQKSHGCPIMRRCYKGLHLKSALISRLQVDWSSESHDYVTKEEASNGSVLICDYPREDVEDTVVISVESADSVFQDDTLHVVGWARSLEPNSTTWTGWKLFKGVIESIDTAIGKVAGLNVNSHVPYVEHGRLIESLPLTTLMIRLEQGHKRVRLFNGEYCSIDSLLPERTKIEPSMTSMHEQNKTLSKIVTPQSDIQADAVDMQISLHESRGHPNALGEAKRDKKYFALYGVAKEESASKRQRTQDTVQPSSKGISSVSESSEETTVCSENIKAMQASHSHAVTLVMFFCRQGSALETEKEQQKLNDIFRNNKSMFGYDGHPRPEYEKHFFGTLEDIQSNNKKAILHFAGHADQGGLFFYNPDGTVRCIECMKLARTMQLKLKHVDLVPLVFMNACRTYDAGKALIDIGVQKVICWRTEVSDSVSVKFSEIFYKEVLACQGDYKAAFELACLACDDELGKTGFQPCFLDTQALLVWYQGNWQDVKDIQELLEPDDNIDTDIHDNEDLFRNWRKPKDAFDFPALAGQAERSCLEALGYQTLLNWKAISLNNGVYNSAGMLGHDACELLGVKKYIQLFGAQGTIVANALALFEHVQGMNDELMVKAKIQQAHKALAQAVTYRKQDAAKFKPTCNLACKDLSACSTCAHASQLKQVEECSNTLENLLTADVGTRASILTGTCASASARGYGDWRDPHSVCNDWKWSAEAGHAERQALQALGIATMMGTPQRPISIGNGVHKNGWLTNSALDVMDPHGRVNVRDFKLRRQYFELLWTKQGLVPEAIKNTSDVCALSQAIQSVNHSVAKRTPPCGFQCGTCTYCFQARAQHNWQLLQITACRHAAGQRLAEVLAAAQAAQPM
jgi:hypothetical protein